MYYIERYIMNRGLSAWLLTIGALIGMVWVVKAFGDIDILTTKGQSILIFLGMTWLAMPSLIAFVIPIALLIAVIFTINAMNSDSELVIINASGAPPKVIYRPFLIMAAMSAIVVASISFQLGPLSLRKLKSLATQVQADIVSVIARENAFNTVSDGITFHLAKRTSGGVLEGIFVQDARDDDAVFTYLARQGSVVEQDLGTFLVLIDGEIHRRDTKADNVSIVKFDSYAFDLSTFFGKTEALSFRPSEMTLAEILNPDVNNPFYRKEFGRYRAELHERFSSALMPFAFVLIMLAFAGQARSTRQTQGVAIASGAIVCVLLEVLWFASVTGSRGIPELVFVIYALPIFGIIIPGYILASGKRLALPTKIAAVVDTLWQKLVLTKNIWRNRFATPKAPDGGAS